MERESFEDIEVAELLRKRFIAVKVDKEERPDIDAVYMQVTQTLTGSGGWPMTVLLTPEKKPFFAGTYFPKKSRYGAAGLMDILNAASAQWETGRTGLCALGDKLSSLLCENRSSAGDTEPSRDMLCRAYDYFSAVFDAKDGGFGHAPKFPSPHNLMFLMRHSFYENEPYALAMAQKTLEQMYRGGLFDHIGGGFSRYSTDSRWLVPHFEKMLYDNALLTIAYLECFCLTGNPVPRRAARRTLQYVLTEMTSPDGGFYCAQDADSNGHEGLYYTWTKNELTGLLGGGDGEYFCDWFSITQSGNFEGRNIPNLLYNRDYASENLRIDALSEIAKKHRQTRAALHKDDKALTSWNSMQLAALAFAYRTLGESEYLTAAKRAVSFIKSKLTGTGGRLRVSFRDGKASGNGYLDDYAFYALALLYMYDASMEPEYLELSLFYAELMCSLFEDSRDGGFYMYSNDAEALISRPKESYDGAVPSGNSAASYVLCRLAEITGGDIWENRARRQLSFMASSCGDHPAAYSFANIAAQSVLYPSLRIICVLPSENELALLRKTLENRFLPNLCVIAVTPENRDRLTALIPSISEYPSHGEKSAFYICQGKTCAAPVTGFDALVAKLDAIYPLRSIQHAQ